MNGCNSAQQLHPLHNFDPLKFFLRMLGILGFPEFLGISLLDPSGLVVIVLEADCLQFSVVSKKCDNVDRTLDFIDY